MMLANGNPLLNANNVTAAPSSPGSSQAPVVITASPVIEQTMIVSINVPVMQTSP